ncbi:hypothetical protein [uncultured Lutibacter sp.]|uniref:hypothetical protein n=1 Tax=uncultured Lutibacter sp. TaxID=437739 RepID=UPI00260F13B7|nr:hypothetical protein [uncultured Lutibacter sp.]
MKLYGIALLPEKKIINELVVWREKLNEYINPPLLGIDENLPHSSILQCPFKVDELTFEKLLEINHEIKSINIPEMSISSVYLKPNNWIFLDYTSKESLFQIQEVAFKHLKNIIDYSSILKKSSYKGYTKLEKDNFEKWGYRYIGKAFIPHFTLGTSKKENQKIPQELVISFNESINGVKFKFTDIVFYEAGYRGALKKVISQVSL